MYYKNTVRQFGRSKYLDLRSLLVLLEPINRCAFAAVSSVLAVTILIFLLRTGGTSAVTACIILRAIIRQTYLYPAVLASENCCRRWNTGRSVHLPVPLGDRAQSAAINVLIPVLVLIVFFFFFCSLIGAHGHRTEFSRLSSVVDLC